MKVIIAGSRKVTLRYFSGGYVSPEAVRLVSREVRKSGFEVTEVVSGMADGADRMGITWAECHHLPVAEFYPDWKAHGTKAGPMRNAQMADYADAVILIWDGRSPGSKNMKVQARRRGIPVHEYLLKPEECRAADPDKAKVPA